MPSLQRAILAKTQTKVQDHLHDWLDLVFKLCPIPFGCVLVLRIVDISQRDVHLASGSCVNYSQTTSPFLIWGTGAVKRLRLLSIVVYSVAEPPGFKGMPLRLQSIDSTNVVSGLDVFHVDITAV
jgi:hypothetical protein